MTIRVSGRRSRRCPSGWGMTAETLRSWIRQHQIDDGQRDGVSSEAAQLPLTGSVCEFIAENRDRFGVAPICRALSEHVVPIAPRTFYAWVKRGRRSGSVGRHHHRDSGWLRRTPGEDGRHKPESLYGSLKVWAHLQRAAGGYPGGHAPTRLAGRATAEDGADHDRRSGGGPAAGPGGSPLRGGRAQSAAGRRLHLHLDAR
jgi:hypothetical protein